MGDKVASITFDIDNLDISKIDKNLVFALDTNILYWTHYSQASNPNLKILPYQVLKYPNFVEKLLDNGNTLVTTIYNITELVHVIENSEYKIYKTLNNVKIGKKDFRKLQSERIKYKQEIETIILQIRSSYNNQIKFIDITEEDMDDFVGNICNNCCDSFDYFIIEKLKKMGINNFITDDRDFQSIDNVTIYYAQI